MNKFIVRVELRNPDDDSYDKLHPAMEKRGFTRTIRASDSVLHDLPPAEYRMVADKTTEEVFDLADAAAATTNKLSYILATQSLGSVFRLKEHKEQKS